MLNINLSSRLAQQNSKLTNFFHTPAQVTILNKTGDVVLNDNVAKFALRKAGSAVNNGIYNVGSKLGKGIQSLLTKTNGVSGFIGKNLSKIPGMNSFARKLAEIGPNSANKIPGLGTLLLLAETAFGAGVAVKRAFQGDSQGAGHQVLKTTGSFIGGAAGLAIAATGIGLVPGLLLATATSIAGNYAGKKIADLMFPKVQAREDLQRELRKQKIYG